MVPIEGVVTHKLLRPTLGMIGCEMSTPRLNGQSGGPAFDTAGKIWGMQTAMAHLDLDVDVDQEVIREGQ